MTAPHQTRPLLTTPFHDRARAASQLDRFVAWSGFSTVDVYTSAEQEYFAIRNTCSVFDLSPMIKYRITGAGAEAFLNRLVTRDVRKLKPGRVGYAVWCNDDGHVIDDGTIFRLGAADYMLCSAERQLNWLLDSAIGFDGAIADVTEAIAALSVQGPTSCAILRAFGLTGVERLTPFAVAEFTMAGSRLTVSRTGFTGDLGYELWMEPGDAAEIWDRLLAAGASRGIRPIGGAALNMARIEAGFIMPRIDFVPAESAVHLNRTHSPFELGLGWLVDFAKGHFTGRRALLAEQQRGPRRRLVGLDIAGNKPAYDALLHADQSCRRRVGSVTSAMWSPTCKRNIALAMVDAPHFAQGRALWAEIYLCRELQWERRVARATVTPTPFFAPARRKVTPPASH